jgi:hypothetical protein
MNLLNDEIDEFVSLCQRGGLEAFSQLGLDFLNILDIARMRLSGLVYPTNDIGIPELDSFHNRIRHGLLQNRQGVLASSPLFRLR